jgi:chemotaxis protein MotA
VSKQKPYSVPSQVRRFDPVAPFAGFFVLGVIVWQMMTGQSADKYFDYRSFVLIFGGLLVTTLWQFSFSTIWTAFLVLIKTLRPSSLKATKTTLAVLDRAIIKGIDLKSIAEGQKLQGSLLNDAFFLFKQGVDKDELEQFLCLRLEKIQADASRSFHLMQKLAGIAPALGLFGTVIGLIELLQTMSDPTKLGGAMSLALLTTAYGSGVSTFILTPMAGRIQQHCQEEIQYHQEFLRKFMILATREDANMIEGHIGKIA